MLQNLSDKPKARWWGYWLPGFTIRLLRAFLPCFENGSRVGFWRRLDCRDKIVLHARLHQGLQQIDVLYRRLDWYFLDRIDLQSRIRCGVPGSFSKHIKLEISPLANAPGTGVADDKAVLCICSKIINNYLERRPILNNVPTYLSLARGSWCVSIFLDKYWPIVGQRN